MSLHILDHPIFSAGSQTNSWSDPYISRDIFNVVVEIYHTIQIPYSSKTTPFFAKEED